MTHTKNMAEQLRRNLPEVMDVNAANDKECERGQPYVTEETQYNLPENITKRHRNAISGANGQSIDKTVSCNDNRPVKTAILIHHPERDTENTSVTAKGGAVPLRAELSTGATDPHEQETIPKEVLDFIKKKQFNKIVVKYILCKLKEKLQNDGKKDVDVVERTVQDIAISMIFYSDSHVQLDELDHDNSKMKFLCFLLTGESQTLAAHCSLLTNIGCKELNDILLLDSDIDVINEYYELTGDILNALGHLLKPKWDSTVRVHILNLQHQTYGQSLCVPYAYGWAVEILEGHISSLPKIKFDESLMVEDLIKNLNSKFQHKRFRQLKLTGKEFESDPEFVKKVVSFKVLISLTDPLPQRWELRCRIYLDIYFFNGSTHERTHKDPRHHTSYKCSLRNPLPKNWEMRFVGNHLLYIDHNTRTSTLDDPRNHRQSENTQLPPGDLQSQDSEMYWSIHAFQHQTQRLEPSAPPLEEFLKEVQKSFRRLKLGL